MSSPCAVKAHDQSLVISQKAPAHAGWYEHTVVEIVPYHLLQCYYFTLFILF